MKKTSLQSIVLPNVKATKFGGSFIGRGLAVSRSVVLKQLVRLDDQRDAQKVHAPQESIVLPDIGGLERKMLIHWHIHRCHNPIAA
jgi:hypothetical protein